MAATTTYPPRNKQASVFRLFDIPVLVSAETVFDPACLAACCVPVPGMEPAVAALQRIYNSVQRVYWNKDRCIKLSTKTMTLVSIICDCYDNRRLEAHNLEDAIERTIDVLLNIARDVEEWAGLTSWKSWYLRHEIVVKIDYHEEDLKTLVESLSLATTLQIHDKIVGLPESLKNTPAGITDRKRAEELLYRLRSDPPGEFSDATPAELACQCVRIGIHPEHSGTRNDIWKGRWLDMQDVALIFSKEYKVAARDHDAIQRSERQVKVWRKLNNAFVLRLYGWCRFGGETYLVCPWMRNGDVRRYLERDKDRHRKCIPLILEIAKGLDYLHDQNVLHGSLKPSNILINDDGHAVLSDFSLAQPAIVGAKNIQINPQVDVFRYQSPEVISDNLISPASDVYSWAMTALEIITDSIPFYTWGSPGKLIMHITQNETPTRSDYSSPVLDKHPEIWELFVKCWSQDPTNRPTAMEVVQAIEKIPPIQ